MMPAENGNNQYHPALRALMWVVPAAALVVIVIALVAGGGGPAGDAVVIDPPAGVDIPWIGFAQIDTLIAGASDAFVARRYEETSRLLSRARFFIHSGIREGQFEQVPPRLELILGLADWYRGFPLKGILYVTSAAEADPENGTYAWYLGRMHLGRGNREDAVKWLEKAAEAGGEHAGEAKALLQEL
jgi:TPR repeat protein